MAHHPLPLIRPLKRDGGRTRGTLMARSVLERHRRHELRPWRTLPVLLFGPKRRQTGRTSAGPPSQTTHFFNLHLAVQPLLALIRERWTRVQPLPAIIVTKEGTVLSPAPRPLPVVAASRELAPVPTPLPPAPNPVVANRGQPQRSSDPSRPAPPALRIERPLPTVSRVTAALSAALAEQKTPPQVMSAPERRQPLATSFAEAPSGTPPLTSRKVIETLTETVLRGIDRRLLSERERRERWT